jgi:GH24 family phage-related lysozyme (muramidase)
VADKSILREYLLKIGFKTDEAEWKKLEGTVARTKSTLAEFATTAITAATAVGTVTYRTAAGLEKMYYAALRTGSSVRNLQAFRFGAEQIGISAENAQNAVEGLAKVLRNSPGQQARLLQFGINPADDPTKILKQLVNLTRRMPHYIGAQVMEGFGVDEETFTMLSQKGALEKLQGGEQARIAKMRTDNVDPDAIARQSKDFMNHMRGIQATMQDIQELSASRVIPTATRLADAFEALAGKVGLLDKLTGGLSTKVGAVAAGIGAAGIAKWLLSKIFGLGGGAAAEGAAGAGAAAEGAGIGGALAGAALPVAAGAAAAFALNKLGVANWIDKTLRSVGINPSLGGPSDAEKSQMWSNVWDSVKNFVTGAGQKGIAEFIKFNEGFKSKVYGDQAGNATIGYGHKLKKGERFGQITETDAATLLGQDVGAAMAAVKRLVKVALNSNQMKALTDLVYNVGDEAFGGSTLLKKLNSGDYAGASAEFDKWNKVKSANGLVTSEGLTTRRARDRSLFEGKPIVQQKTDIIVKGNDDPTATARAVAKQQNQVNSDMVRNMSGALDTVGATN